MSGEKSSFLAVSQRALYTILRRKLMRFNVHMVSYREKVSFSSGVVPLLCGQQNDYCR